MAATAGCEFGRTSVAPQTPTIVVHCILDLSAGQGAQVFVERTLTGATTVFSTPTFNASDPIRSTGGIPVNGASVEIIDSAGTVFQGTEDGSTGVYEVPLGPIGHGERYELRVHAPTGEDVIGITTTPQSPLGPLPSPSMRFNRDQDTLHISWNAVPAAKNYLVGVETPFGTYFLIADSTAVRFTGGLRNPFDADLHHVFLPGFDQNIVVDAVDSNFYNYYRTVNDPFTGTGVISNLQGGSGVFASVGRVFNGGATVTASQMQPPAGTYFATQPLLAPNGRGTTPGNYTLQLYVDAPSAAAGVPGAITGTLTLSEPLVAAPSQTQNLLGQFEGNFLAFATLGTEDARDTTNVFVGVLTGDTLVGQFRNGGSRLTFVRQ